MRSQAVARGRIASIGRYFREVIAELKKAVWPTSEEVKRLTIMVIIVSIAVGIFLGAIDLGFTELVKLFFGG